MPERWRTTCHAGARQARNAGESSAAVVEETAADHVWQALFKAASKKRCRGKDKTIVIETFVEP
jgi:hypothetical protein